MIYANIQKFRAGVAFSAPEKLQKKKAKSLSFSPRFLMQEISPEIFLKQQEFRPLSSHNKTQSSGNWVKSSYFLYLLIMTKPLSVRLHTRREPFCAARRPSNPRSPISVGSRTKVAISSRSKRRISLPQAIQTRSPRR